MKRVSFYACKKDKTFEKVKGYIDLITLYNGAIVRLGVFRPYKNSKWILTELSSGMALGITGATIKETFNKLTDSVKDQERLIAGMESDLFKEIQEKLSDYIIEESCV